MVESFLNWNSWILDPSRKSQVIEKMMIYLIDRVQTSYTAFIWLITLNKTSRVVTKKLRIAIKRFIVDDYL